LAVADAALAALAAEFQQLHALTGRPSIAPEKLLRALLLQALYSLRSERQLMEQVADNLLFRWFVGLGGDDPVGNVTVFTQHRDRLLEGEIAAKFLRAVLARRAVRALLSDGHFPVDGTLIQARRRLCRRPRCGRIGPWPMGQHEVVPAEGWLGRLDDGIVQPGAGPHQRARLPWRATDQRHPCLDHRSRGQARPQGPRQGGQARFPARPPARPWPLAGPDRALCARSAMR
jgi:transposase